MAINDKLLNRAIKMSEKVYSSSKQANSIYDYRNGKSLRTMTKDLIMQFPLLISEQITYKTAQLLAEGFERENALLVKLLLMNDLGGLSSDLIGDKNSVIGMLQKIHTNIDGNPLNETMMRDFNNANLSQLVPIEAKFNKYSLNEGTLPKYLTEANFNSTSSSSSTEFRIEKDPRFPNEDRYREIEDTTTSERTSEKSFNFSDRNLFKPDLFEKINKNAPTIISMSLHHFEGSKESSLTSEKTSNTTRDVEVAFGVKCIVHQLKSDDIIHNVSSSVANNTLFKAIKWTTGEYGFLKGIGEILFDYNRVKTLGIQAAKTSNYWWFKLRKLKNSQRSKFWSGSKKINPTRTATLILSKEEIDYIATNYRIDLKQPKQAYKLLNDLFLLNFGFVDETTESVYLFDEFARSYTIKNYDDFKSKTKNKPLDIDDIKSLFGR